MMGGPRSMLARGLARLDGFELVVSNLCLASLVIVLAAQVFFRYVLHTGLSWSEEVSRFTFIWFVYLSASLAAQRGTHIRVTMFTRWFPGGERVALLLADAVWIVFNAFVVIAGVLLIQRTMRYPVYSTSLFMPLAAIYSVIPLAHALMILRIVQRQWLAWTRGVPIVAEQTVSEPPAADEMPR